MIRRFLLCLAILALVGADLALAAGSERFVLVPLKRRVRDAEAAISVETALRFQLTEYGELVSSLETRDELRRLRLRDVDSASPEVIHQLATELSANWIVVATLHDVLRREVSDLTLSIRFYEGSSGNLAWASFMGRNGLDGRKLLGLGVLTSMDDLAKELVGRTLEAAMTSMDRSPGSAPSLGQAKSLGRVALVPFTGYVQHDALAVADAATEASRAVLMRQGLPLAAPGCVSQALRLQRAQVWGELTAEARTYLEEECGADSLLTGSVAQWQINGSAYEPVPEIALALRLLNASSGRILWMSSIEKTGRSSESLFRKGRIYSRGRLLDRILTRLTEEMLTETSLPTG